MKTNREIVETVEAVQRMAVKLLATSPAGEGMYLIGGGRYRLLDHSCRHSLDLDYHWQGNLEKKQTEIVALFRRKLLPLIRARLGFDGSVSCTTGPDAGSPVVKTVEIAVWKSNGTTGRITISVDITRIICLDKPIVRTVDGVVCLSASDADMVESKVVALFARMYTEARDLVDIFLFQEKFVADSAQRVGRKLDALPLSAAQVAEMLNKLIAERDCHIRNIEGIIREQLDPPAAKNINRSGGGAIIFEGVMDLLNNRLKLSAEQVAHENN